MESAATYRSRWPGVLGLVGIIIAVLMFWDALSDLIQVFTWDEQDWVRMLGAETAALIEKFAPPVGYQVASGLINLELSILLFVASILLLRRQRVGVTLSRVWAWLVLPLLAIQMLLVLTWMKQHLAGLLRPEWQVSESTIVIWTVFVFLILAAYPVFLLAWLGRPSVRGDYATWNVGTSTVM